MFFWKAQTELTARAAFEQSGGALVASNGTQVNWIINSRFGSNVAKVRRAVHHLSGGNVQSSFYVCLVGDWRCDVGARRRHS
jgi:hypothetical protein